MSFFIQGPLLNQALLFELVSMLYIELKLIVNKIRLLAIKYKHGLELHL